MNLPWAESVNNKNRKKTAVKSFLESRTLKIFFLTVTLKKKFLNIVLNCFIPKKKLKPQNIASKNRQPRKPRKNIKK